MANSQVTQLERESLEAHVDLCALRNEALDKRLITVEEKMEHIHQDIITGQASMTKVLIGTAGTIIAGLLSTVIVIVMQM